MLLVALTGGARELTLQTTFTRRNEKAARTVCSVFFFNPPQYLGVGADKQRFDSFQTSDRQ